MNRYVMCKKKHRERGFTFIELIITIAIVAILASATMPLLKISVQRKKELELRENLRQIRMAIDAYKLAYDENRIGGELGLKSLDKTGYPPSLEVLVEGVPSSGADNKKIIRFLRRIPRDPFHEKDPMKVQNAWGLRSYESDPQKPSSGKDVYDVYSLSPLTGSNGVPYEQW